MTDDKPKTWYVAGCLAEEDTDKPFDGATLVIEHSAYTALEQKIKDLEKEIADTATISYMISAEHSRDVVDKLKLKVKELEGSLCDEFNYCNATAMTLHHDAQRERDQYKEQCEILVSYIREEYEDYYRHIDKHDTPVTKEYTRCIGNLSKALTAYQEFKEGL